MHVTEICLQILAVYLSYHTDMYTNEKMNKKRDIANIYRIQFLMFWCWNLPRINDDVLSFLMTCNVNNRVEKRQVLIHTKVVNIKNHKNTIKVITFGRIDIWR